MGADEDFLGDVLGLCRVAEHAERDAVDTVLLFADEILEGPPVTRAEPREKLRRVARNRLSHGCRHPRPEPIAGYEIRTS
jgi:hypothetical protein